MMNLLPALVADAAPHSALHLVEGKHHRVEISSLVVAQTRNLDLVMKLMQIAVTRALREGTIVNFVERGSLLGDKYVYEWDDA